MAGVTLKNVFKSYDGTNLVIKDVSLEIANGEFCVFVGPSGCGKSTLLRMVAGLEDITSGDLFIGDKQVNKLAPSERNVAMVFQNYALYPHMDVTENIGFGMRLAGYDKDTIKSRVDRIADILQIQPLMQRKPRALSGGQRQRVAIGRALVRDPGVFLFDEPLSNLDAALRTQMRVEIAKLHRQYGKASTIYVTHDQVEAMTLADKIVLLHTGADVLKYGSVAQVGSPLELYARPRNLFVAGFIGSPKMNFIKASVLRIENDGVVVETPQKRVLKAAVSADNRLKNGDEVTLGIRSEHMELADSGKENTLPCRVQWVERLGDMTYAYLQPEQEEQIIVRLGSKSTVAIEDNVSLYIQPQECHLFDAEGLALPRILD